MFLYFNSNGVLKEIINDKALRQGNYENKIYIYIDGIDLNELTNVWFKYRLPNDTTTLEVALDTIEPVSLEIPYNRKRDLKFFEYNKSYEFLEIPTSFEYEDTQYNALELPGNVALTVRCYPAPETLGLIVFNVEESVEGNIIKPDEYISLAQFTYLLNRLNEIGSGSGGGSEPNEDLVIKKMELYYPKVTKIDEETGDEDILVEGIRDFYSQYEQGNLDPECKFSYLKLHIQSNPINSFVESKIKSNKLILRLDYPIYSSRSHGGVGKRNFVHNINQNPDQTWKLARTFIYIEETDIKTDNVGRKYIDKYIPVFDLFQKMVGYNIDETEAQDASNDLGIPKLGKHKSINPYKMIKNYSAQDIYNRPRLENFTSALKDENTSNPKTTEWRGYQKAFESGENNFNQIGIVSTIYSKLKVGFGDYSYAFGGFTSPYLKGGHHKNRGFKKFIYYRGIYENPNNNIQRLVPDIDNYDSRKPTQTVKKINTTFIARPRFAILKDEIPEDTSQSMWLYTYPQSETQIRFTVPMVIINQDTGEVGCYATIMLVK